MSNTALEDFLTGDEVEAEEPTGATEESEAKAEPTEADEPEQSDEKAEDSPPESEKPKPPPETVPTAALADERAKRQQLQRELDELRHKLERQQAPQKPAEPDETPVDFLDDPDKWIAQKEAAWKKELHSVRTESQAKFLSLVENAARARHEDFDDVVSAFGEAARQNPQLAQEMLNAPDPAEFAYSAGKRLRMLSEAGGDLDLLLERERAKARQEALEELKQSQSAVDIPESLSNVPASNKRADKVVVDTPLEKLFNNY